MRLRIFRRWARPEIFEEIRNSPNQVLTHAARAAASQLNFRVAFSATLWPRAARTKGPGQGKFETRIARQGFGLWFWSEGQKIKSRDCALASDLVKARVISAR